MSCGVELRTSLENNRVTNSDQIADKETQRCIKKMRAASVKNIGAIETWWQWCNRQYSPATNSCTSHWDISSRLDWIGINVYPWWENKFSGFFPCTRASKAAKFVVDRVRNVRKAHRKVRKSNGLKYIVTEHGWPAGPRNHRETNQRFPHLACGLASPGNQRKVLRATRDKLKKRGWSGVLFQAFREPFKEVEGEVGPYWGMCRSKPPFKCVSLK